MDDAWWGPAIPLRRRTVLLSGRAHPARRPDGQPGRATGSSTRPAPYSDVVHTMYDQNATDPDIPAWLIIDQNYRDRYLFRDIAADPAVPRLLVPAGAVLQGLTLRRAGRADRRPGRRADVHGRPLQRPRPHRQGHRLPARATAPTTTTTPTPPSSRTPAWRRCGCPVLRLQDRPRRPRHEGRHAHRRPGARAARGRLGHPAACTPPATPVRPSWGTVTRARARPSARDDVRLHRRQRHLNLLARLLRQATFSGAWRVLVVVATRRGRAVGWWALGAFYGFAHGLRDPLVARSWGGGRGCVGG